MVSARFGKITASDPPSKNVKEAGVGRAKKALDGGVVAAVDGNRHHLGGAVDLSRAGDAMLDVRA